jgi:spermidine synthase
MTENSIYQIQDNDGSIQVKEQNGFRTLHFDSEPTQSAMSLEKPDELQLDYAKAMMSFLLFKELEDDDFLLMGLGGGSIAKFVLQNFPQCRIEAVEYRAEVAEIAHDYFALPREKNLNVVIDCGAHYALERCELQKEFYSVIMLDAFDATGMATALCNPEFFAACKAMLKKDGILVVDLWNATEQFKQLISWIGSLFEAKLLFLPVDGVVNVIGLFFNENTPIYSRRELQRRAIKLEKIYNLPFKQFLKDLIKTNPNFIDRVTCK